MLRGDVVADMNETDTNSILSKEAAGPSGKKKQTKTKPDSWLLPGVDC